MVQNKGDARWIGQTLNRNYRIDSVLGKGGQAVIYRGFDILLQEEIAIKQFMKKGEQENLERFKREARHQMKLVHQNIVGTRAIIEESDEYFIVMEYIDGTDLGHLISVSEERPCMPLNQIRQIFSEVLAGLGYAHQQGVIHRDIKPPNIMLTQDYKVKLADFGLARQLQDKRITVDGQMLGTPAYTAPEILQGASTLDPRCDIYSIGVSLYETICGSTPFLNPGEGLAPFELLGRHMFMEPESPLKRGIRISPDLNEVVMQSIAKDPDERFMNCEEFQDALLSSMQDATQIWEVQQAAAEQDFSRDTTIIERPEFAEDASLVAEYTTGNKTEHDVAAIPEFIQKKLIESQQEHHSSGTDTSHDELAAQPEHLTKMTEVEFNTQPQMQGVPRQRSSMALIVLGVGLLMVGLFALYKLVGIPTPATTADGGARTNTRTPPNTRSRVALFPQIIPGVPMVYVPQGSFDMGKVIAKRGSSFSPVRKIFLSAYWIDTFEVTVKQYRACVDNGGCANPRKLYLSKQVRMNVPITRVTWDEASRFCRWMGKRLPSEAQWEKAARGPKAYDYPWGNSKRGCEFANRCGCNSRVLPIGLKQRAVGRSHYAAYDMSGNANEWTRDCFKMDVYKTFPSKDPVYLGSNCSSRTVRGGSYSCNKRWLSYSYTRLGINRNARQKDIGFRCAWKPPMSSPTAP